MKKILALNLALFMGSIAHAAVNLPPHADIQFKLATIEDGSINCPSFLKHAAVEVEYDYNFNRNTGLARVKKMQTVYWGEPLYPLGISSVYTFMSDMIPTPVPLPEGDVTVYRVFFKLYHNGDSQLLMMLGQDGNCIMSSDIVNVNSVLS